MLQLTFLSPLAADHCPLILHHVGSLSFQEAELEQKSPLNTLSGYATLIDDGCLQTKKLIGRNSFDLSNEHSWLGLSSIGGVEMVYFLKLL